MQSSSRTIYGMILLHSYSVLNPQNKIILDHAVYLSVFADLAARPQSPPTLRHHRRLETNAVHRGPTRHYAHGIHLNY
jgi:hypothetical protein